MAERCESRFEGSDAPEIRRAPDVLRHTHAFDAAVTTPYLVVNSAAKRSGKTTLLEVLELLVRRPWLTGRVSAAVLVRKTDKEKPTLLLDESDAAFAGEKEYSEALRGILNTGFKASGRTSLCVGQGANITYKDFRTFGPKAIAGISRLPDTIMDRAIVITLKRRARSETVERFRGRVVRKQVEPLKRQIEAWAVGNLSAIRGRETGTSVSRESAAVRLLTALRAAGCRCFLDDEDSEFTPRLQRVTSSGMPIRKKPS